MSEPSNGRRFGPAKRQRVGLPGLGVPAPRGQRGPFALGLLAMAVGVGVWYLFAVVSPTHPSEPFPGARKWGATVFAAVFFLFGLRFALEGLHAPDWWTLRRFRGGRERWGEGFRWRREMKPLPAWKAEKRGWGKGLVGCLALVAFGGMINLIWFDLDALSGDVWVAYILVPLFTLLILFLLAGAAWEIVRQLRFRAPRIRFETYPVAPGGELRVTLVHRGRFRKAQSAKVTLACLAQGPPERATGTAVVEALLAVEQAIPLADLAANPRELAIAIDIPAEALSTRLAQPDGSRRYWVLEFAAYQGKLRETESTSFLVPVYDAIPSEKGPALAR